MKKLLAILLCLAMMLSVLAGCSQTSTTTGTGNGKEDPEPNDESMSDEELILGTWEWEMDFTDYAKECMGEDAEYFDLEDLSLTFVFTFDEDTCELKVDKDSVEEWVDQYMDAVEDGLDDYLEALIEAADLDMTVDEYLEASGMTEKEMLDGIREGLEEIVGDLKSLSEEGEYTIEDDQIVIHGDDDDQYLSYKVVNNNTIKITDVEDEEMDEDELEEMKELMGIPATMKRVK